MYKISLLEQINKIQQSNLSPAIKEELIKCAIDAEKSFEELKKKYNNLVPWSN